MILDHFALSHMCDNSIVLYNYAKGLIFLQGMIEAAGGLGYCIGPPLGGALYAVECMIHNYSGVLDGE